MDEGHGGEGLVPGWCWVGAGARGVVVRRPAVRTVPDPVVVGPAVTGIARGGEGKSEVNGLGASREEGRIIELKGRFHGSAASTMGSTSYAPAIAPCFNSQYVTLLARLDPFGLAPC